jgi:2-iminoacetate synthase ThiH
MTVEKIEALIREAGCTPQERDSLYRRITRTNGNWQVAV